MKKMKVYKVYLEDRTNAFRVIVPACSEKEAREFVAGNGEVVAIKETKDYPLDAGKVAYALKKDGFGQAECDIITRTLQQLGLAE